MAYGRYLNECRVHENTINFTYLKMTETAGGDGKKVKVVTRNISGRNMYRRKQSVLHFPTVTILSTTST